MSKRRVTYTEHRLAEIAYRAHLDVCDRCRKFLYDPCPDGESLRRRAHETATRGAGDPNAR